MSLFPYLEKMSKIYAVKAGHKPGIYSTWEEAKEQITGYPGAKHQSFKNREDADAYMALTNFSKALEYANLARNFAVRLNLKLEIQNIDRKIAVIRQLMS
jgi:viroplasmin and RNaseH domain-containing protein